MLGERQFDLRGLRRLPTDATALAVRVRLLTGAEGDPLGDVGRILADAPVSPALRGSLFDFLAGLDGLRPAERPAGLGRLPAGTASVGRRGTVDTVLAFDPRSGRVVAQVSTLVRASGRGGRSRFRAGDRIGEYRWGPSGAVPTRRERP